MKNQDFVSLCVFGLISIIFFFGGALGIILTVKHLNSILGLEASEIIEDAIVTGVGRRIRTPSNEIYFETISDNKVYRFHLLKLTHGANVGDKIEVRFNEERTLFYVVEFSSARFITFIVQIVLFLGCLVFSILFLKYDTLDLYKSIRIRG